MRILVAEDETIIRLDLRALLEGAGFEVCAEAKDGLEAVELARSELPDLAVLDVKMPRLDGIEAARRILEEDPIPIVMLTAYGHDERESGQEEVYIPLRGSGVLRVEGDEVPLEPGCYVLVEPEAMRQVVAGPEGLSYAVVGAVCP